MAALIRLIISDMVVCDTDQATVEAILSPGGWPILPLEAKSQKAFQGPMKE